MEVPVQCQPVRPQQESGKEKGWRDPSRVKVVVNYRVPNILELKRFSIPSMNHYKIPIQGEHVRPRI
jgi:hypothetical protein